MHMYFTYRAAAKECERRLLQQNAATSKPSKMFFTVAKESKRNVGFGFYGCRSLAVGEKDHHDDSSSCYSDNLDSISQTDISCCSSDDSISWKSFSSVSTIKYESPRYKKSSTRSSKSSQSIRETSASKAFFFRL